jgi:hypothetical protein
MVRLVPSAPGLPGHSACCPEIILGSASPGRPIDHYCLIIGSDDSMPRSDKSCRGRKDSERPCSNGRQFNLWIPCTFITLAGHITWDENEPQNIICVPNKAQK